MRKLLLFSFFSLVMISVIMNSCREPFLPDFKDVEIINAPPKVSGLDTLNLTVGFGSVDIDLSGFISDQEGDDLIVTAESENPAVVSTSLSGLILTLFEEGTGNATILLTIDDGVDRGELVDASFVVIVEEQSVFYKFFLDLTGIPNGTNFDEYILEDGTEIGRPEASEGSSRVVQNGVMVWTTDEWDVMSIIFAEPLNLLSDATFRFEYADLWSEDFWVTIVDAYGGEAGFGDGEPFEGEMVLNSPSFNTFEIDLNDYTDGEVDLSAITEIYIEKYGAEQSETFKFRNLGIGIYEPFILEFSTIPNGTSFDEYTLEDGTEIGRAEASEESSRIVQNGVLEWSTDEWDVMSIIFPEPRDFSINPTFSIQYADLFSDDFGLIIVDAYGGEAGFGWEEEPFLGEMVLNSSSYNTFEFDLSVYTGQDVDLSAVTEIYFEKFGAEGLQTFKLKELAIGK